MKQDQADSKGSVSRNAPLRWPEQNAHGDLQVEIHKAYRIGGVDALPKLYNRTIFLCGKHDKEKGQNPNAC